MANRKKKEIGIIVLLLVAVAIMTIGFAAYTQTLNITGNLTVKGSPWNVHYVENSITPTTGSVTATNPSVTKTDFTFTVTLEKPGDFYEATIQAWNEGTIDANLKKITMSTLSEAQGKYLKYTVKYNGTEYNATSNVTGVTLAKGAKHPVVVRVEYLEPATSAELPATDQTITVTGNLDYESVSTTP